MQAHKKSTNTEFLIARWIETCVFVCVSLPYVKTANTLSRCWCVDQMDALFGVWWLLITAQNETRTEKKVGRSREKNGRRDGKMKSRQSGTTQNYTHLKTNWQKRNCAHKQHRVECYAISSTAQYVILSPPVRRGSARCQCCGTLNQTMNSTSNDHHRKQLMASSISCVRARVCVCVWEAGWSRGWVVLLWSMSRLHMYNLSA